MKTNYLLKSIHSLIPILFISMLLPPFVQAQWTNHYEKLDDFGHHVYLEQHELPILSHGTIDLAPGQDGESLVFAAQGVNGLFDLVRTSHHCNS